jgi:hypothetical protein
MQNLLLCLPKIAATASNNCEDQLTRNWSASDCFLVDSTKPAMPLALGCGTATVFSFHLLEFCIRAITV